MATHSGSEIKKDILTRVRILYVFFIVVGLTVFGRVLWIQFGPEGEDLRSRGDEITYARDTIRADRGDILAVDGRILASSIPTFDIRMDFAAHGLTNEVFDSKVDSLAYRLASFFKDKSVAAYKTKLVNARRNKAKNRYTQIIPRRVNYLELAEIRKFPILKLGQNKGGIVIVPVSRRIYPHGSLALRTIGSVNESGTKVGVEGAFDETLRGTNGNTLMQRISGSFQMPVQSADNVEPVNGLDVVTTIDVDIQDVAERALKQQLDQYYANWGAVVLMEVETGEVRAMANLTRKSEGVFVEDLNYVVGRNLEPGSTFKLASLITLLDDGKMNLDDQVDTGNSITTNVGGAKITDTHNYGKITLREVFEVSSNIGFAKSVYAHYGNKPSRFVDKLCDMGFDKPLGVQIPGEPDPLLWHPARNKQNWSGVTLQNMAYGYGLEITPLHTLAFYNAVANGGRMVKPKLVKEIRRYGETIRTFPTETLVSSICSQKTLRQVQGCLEGVVSDGTAKLLRSPHYTVAGKTGTARIAQGRHGYIAPNGGIHYLATLVGYFPADKPRYSCIVVIKTYYGPGSYHTYYGATLAGPVFRAVADRVNARSITWQEPVEARHEQKNGRPVPIKGGEAADVRRVAGKLSLPFENDRSLKEWVRTRIDSVHVSMTELDGTAGRVPDVRGMGLKDAVYLLEKRGLKVAFRGGGRVVSQSLRPGDPAIRGQNVEIVLEI